jgi:UDP-N-acetylmuramate--alanine ligase
LAAIAIAVELNIPDEAVKAALHNFTGVDRRFQHHGQVRAKGGGSFTLIEDYGHHPVELRATLEAARGAFPQSRLLLAFQPHRYTRTRDCFEDFVRVLQLADWVCLTPVYAAGEAPIVAADSRALMRSLRIQGFEQVALSNSIDDISAQMLELARDGDVVMCMGAGSIGQVPALMLAQVAKEAA